MDIIYAVSTSTQVFHGSVLQLWYLGEKKRAQVGREDSTRSNKHHLQSCAMIAAHPEQQLMTTCVRTTLVVCKLLLDQGPVQLGLFEQPIELKPTQLVACKQLICHKTRATSTVQTTTWSRSSQPLVGRQLLGQNPVK